MLDVHPASKNFQATTYSYVVDILESVSNGSEWSVLFKNKYINKKERDLHKTPCNNHPIRIS